MLPGARGGDVEVALEQAPAQAPPPLLEQALAQAPQGLLPRQQEEGGAEEELGPAQPMPPYLLAASRDEWGRMLRARSEVGCW